MHRSEKCLIGGNLQAETMMNTDEKQEGVPEVEEKKGIQLDDSMLDAVSGGTGSAGADSGIKCPNCNSDSVNFIFRDPNTGSIEYACICGCQFVYYKGNTVLKSKWIELCKKRDYIYTNC